MQRDRHGRSTRTDGDRTRRPPQGFRAADPGRFRQLALDALADLPRELAEAAAGAQITVASVPPAPSDPAAPPALASFTTAKPGQPPRLVLCRRPIELRAADRADLVEVVRAAAIQAIADALGNPSGLVDDEGR